MIFHFCFIIFLLFLYLNLTDLMEVSDDEHRPFIFDFFIILQKCIIFFILYYIIVNLLLGSDFRIIFGGYQKFPERRFSKTFYRSIIRF